MEKVLKSEKEKMLSGELYSPIDRELIKERDSARKLLKQFNIKEFVTGKKSQSVLATLMPHAAPDIVIVAPFYCDYGYNIHCGSRVFFNVNCVVLDVMKVTIGNNVLIGPAVQIYTATHPNDAVTRRKKMFGKEVVIGNDCWIGGGAIINPGVVIGDNCVIGAGSVVTKSIPPHSMAVGNPARVIRKIK